MSLNISIMKKRIITLLALLVLLPVMVFATDVVITWQWMLDDPQVTGFRYQLNGEDPEGWTVVDGMTSSCVFENLDSSKEYTLYLQQTYDGVNWSPSAVSTAMPVVVADDTMVEEPAAMDDAMVEESQEVAMVDETTEEVVDAASEDKMMAEEEVVDAASEEITGDEQKKDKKSSYYTSISLRGSGVYALNAISGNIPYDNLSASVGIGLGFNNIFKISSVGFGLNVNADYILAPYDGQALNSLNSFFTDTSITDYSLRVTLAPEMEFNVGRVVVNFAGLVDATLVDFPYVGTLDIDEDFASTHILLGYGGQFGLAFKVNDHFQIGTDAKFRRFGGLDGEWGVEVTPALVLTF